MKLKDITQELRPVVEGLRRHGLSDTDIERSLFGFLDAIKPIHSFGGYPDTIKDQLSRILHSG